MAQNTVKTRIQLKYDTEANWNKAGPKPDGRLGFVPLRGEIIIYSPDESRHFCRIKVGDGSTPVVDLPFIPYDGNSGSGGGDGNAKIQIHTTIYWQQHSNYIPELGEIIIYSDRRQNGNYNEPGIKIGDGITYVVDLPFIDETIESHITNNYIHVSSIDREFWNNKINCNDNVNNETLILIRR